MTDNNTYDRAFVKSIISEPTKVFFEHHPANHFEVDNCLDAAAARKIRLEEELKSIVLKVNDKFYIFHFRGNENLNSRIIEKYFRGFLKIKTKNKFRFATIQELNENFDSAKGKVTPINKKIWDIYSFISPTLLNRKVVYTNDGSLTGYIKFDPILLARSPNNNIKDKLPFFVFTTKFKIPMRTDAHKATSGLLDTAHGSDELDRKMRKFYGKAVTNDFTNPTVSGHRYVRIIDTFFSDTIDSKLLLEIVRQSKSHKYQIQIVLLNPFTESAEEREKSLPRPENRIKRLNRGLYKIKNALKGTDDSFNDEFSNNFEKADYIFVQIDEINRIKTERHFDNFELRFSMVGRLPLYMFGQYACSGQFLDFASSRETPWYFWVDDPNETDDQYDNFKKHFESLWRNSCELKAIDFREYLLKNSERLSSLDTFGINRRNMFFSYGHDDDTRLRVESLVRKQDFIPVIFDDEKMTTNDERIIPGLLKSNFNKCSSALVIMTKDDILQTGGGRPRPNVLLELGYAQALYGPLVLLLVEEGLEIPTNLSGYLFAFFKRDDKGNAILPENEISAFITRIKQQLG